jgi:hypothetical protein
VVSGDPVISALPLSTIPKTVRERRKGIRHRSSFKGLGFLAEKPPDGSKIVKLQWKPKKSTEAHFVVGKAGRCPETPALYALIMVG